MKQAILAIDQGTTSSRAILFTPEGKQIATAQKEHKQHYPKAGWVEHDAEEIWQNVKSVCQKVLEDGAQKGFEAVTIGITNQRETVVAWNKTTGRPFGRALVWQDKRTSGICEKLQKANKTAVKEKTGMPLDAYFSAPKMQWIMLNIEGVQDAADAENLAFGTMDSFILWRLTGGTSFKTDITNACRTLLFNIHTKQWDADLLDLFGIPAHTLPSVHPNAHSFGTTTEGLFDAPLPIEGMAGDQQAATIGQACFEKGMLKSTYGTGCFAMLNTGETPVPSENGLLTTICYQIGTTTTYALEGSIFVAGSAVQWLRDQVGIIDHAKDMEDLAKQAVDEDGVYFVPAFAGLGAPYWNANAKAAIVGMTLDTNKAALARATLEAMAFQTHDLMAAMNADSKQTITSLRVDGGMVVNDWMLQRMADILNLQVERPQVIETTALGAAYLAGLQHGMYKNLTDITQYWQRQGLFTPEMDAATRTAKHNDWAHALRQVQT